MPAAKIQYALSDSIVCEASDVTFTQLPSGLSVKILSTGCFAPEALKNSAKVRVPSKPNPSRLKRSAIHVGRKKRTLPVIVIETAPVVWIKYGRLPKTME